ncbi:MAG: hypothetical protein GKR93_11240 [Gammaproteobacteria bacterium]|nr:hypothetical protein [Gammaproteobacteria bacterium]
MSLKPYIGTIKENLAVAVAYYLAGEMGLLLAIPPSNAVAVWPAAGLAFVAILVRGYRVMPGVLIGSVLIQTLSNLDASSTDAINSSFLIGLIVSFGVTLQATIGAWTAGKLLKHDRALLRERSIILFCLLAGPVSCLISASIAITTLHISGVISSDDLSISWFRWWIGDSVGVLAFSPILLCFFARPRQLWRKRILSVGMPLLILASVCVLAFMYSNSQQMLLLEDIFEKNSNTFNFEFHEVIQSHTESTHEMKEYFDNSLNITNDDFVNYTSPKLARNPAIRTLAWIPKIEHAGREEFERSSGKTIQIRNEHSQKMPAPENQFYYPIHFAMPKAKNETAYGFDLGSWPIMYQAMKAACTTGDVTVTSPVNFVENGVAVTGIYFYAPVYSRKANRDGVQTCEEITGYVASVFRLKKSIDGIHLALDDLNLNTKITDADGLIYDNSPMASDNHQPDSVLDLTKTFELRVAQKKWKLTITPKRSFFSGDAPWILWLIIVTEMFIAGIAGTGLLLLAGRTMLTERKVKQRTSDLNHEIKNRKKSSALLALEKDFLEMIAEDKPSQLIFDSITTGIREIVPQTKPAIILFDPDSGEAIHTSHSGLPDGYINNTDGFPDLFNSGLSETGNVADKQYVLSNIVDSPEWLTHRDQAMVHGLLSCVASPVTISRKTPVGVFALYFESSPVLTRIWRIFVCEYRKLSQ